LVVGQRLRSNLVSLAVTLLDVESRDEKESSTH